MKKVLSRFGASALILVAFFVTVGGKPTSAAGAQDNQAANLQVNIDNFSFGPATLTVPAGATVTWTNHDDVPHNVVSTQKLFASPVLDTDERFSYKFTAPGTYPYYCSIHPKMTAKIVVQ